MMTKENLDHIRKALEHGDVSRLLDLMTENAVDLVAELDAAVKLAAKAMTGGNITREDGATLSRLCKLIGHEP